MPVARRETARSRFPRSPSGPRVHLGLGRHSRRARRGFLFRARRRLVSQGRLSRGLGNGGRLPGTSPEEMETSVTRPIEEAINTVLSVSTSCDRPCARGLLLLSCNSCWKRTATSRHRKSATRFGNHEANALGKWTCRWSTSSISTSCADHDHRHLGAPRRARSDRSWRSTKSRKCCCRCRASGGCFCRVGHTRTINVNLDPYQLTSYSLSVEDVAR